MYFLKWNNCFCHLDVQETNFLDYVSGCRIAHGWVSHSWDMVIEVLRSTNNNVQPKHTSIQETGATVHSKSKPQKIQRRLKVYQVSDVESRVRLAVRLFNFFEENFQMYSCSRFSDFLCDDNVRKQSARSKRGRRRL